jgi:Bacterial PH domain
MQKFSAILDNTSKILTAVLAPIFLVVPTSILLSLRTQTDKSYQGYMIGLCILLSLIFLIVYLLSPQHYIVDGKKLKVVTKYKTFHYDLEKLEKAQSVTKDEMGFLIRIFGNGGLFGYTGYFTSKHFGRMQFWVTDTNQMAMLTFSDNKKVVISPKEMDAFIKALKK